MFQLDGLNELIILLLIVVSRIIHKLFSVTSRAFRGMALSKGALDGLLGAVHDLMIRLLPQICTPGSVRKQGIEALVGFDVTHFGILP